MPDVSCRGVMPLMQVCITCSVVSTYLVQPMAGVHGKHFNALGLCFGLIQKEFMERCLFTLPGFSDVVPVYNTSKNYETVNVKAQTETAGSSLLLYKELVEARATPSIMYGTREFAVIGNNTVFAFTRYVPHHTGYMQLLVSKNVQLLVPHSLLATA